MQIIGVKNREGPFACRLGHQRLGHGNRGPCRNRCRKKGPAVYSISSPALHSEFSDPLALTRYSPDDGYHGGQIYGTWCRPASGCNSVWRNLRSHEGIVADALLAVRAAPGGGSRPNLASVLQEGRKTANIQPSSGVIWRILDKNSLGATVGQAH